MDQEADRLSNRRGVMVWCAALFVSLSTLLLVWRSQHLIDNRPDPYWFSAMGKSFARGQGFDQYGVLLHRRAPLYPIFIGVIYEVFGEHDLLVQLAQCALFATTCWLAYDMARRVYGERVGLIAGALTVFCPSLLRYVSDFHLETLLTFLVTLTVWRTVVFTERPNLRNGILFGVAAGLASLTKAVVLLYPPLFAAAYLFFTRRSRGPGDRHVLVSLVASFIAMGLVILPWTVRNYERTGHPVLISTGLSDAYLRGVVFSKPEYATLEKAPYTDGENESNAMFRELCSAQGTVWEKDDWETDRILNRAAKERFLSRPGEFIRKFATGLFTFWYEMTTLKNSIAAGLLALVAWLFAFIGVPRSYREGRPAWLFFGPVLYLNVLLAALLALGRYSIPVLPSLLAASAFGIDTLLERLRVPFFRRSPS